MSDVVQKLWGFCHTLRHDGVDYGDYIEQIGYYDPRKPDFRLDHERYQSWLKTGARPSDTVATLVKSNVPADAAVKA